MKKKLMAIIFSLIFIFSLTACSDDNDTVQVNVSNNESISSNQFGEFVHIGGELYYDSATRIVYRRNHNTYGSIFIPYLAPNGLPYKYNTETNTFEEIGK